VGRIVKASPFDKPEAVAVLLLAGLETGALAGHRLDIRIACSKPTYLLEHWSPPL